MTCISISSLIRSHFKPHSIEGIMKFFRSIPYPSNFLKKYPFLCFCYSMYPESFHEGDVWVERVQNIDSFLGGTKTNGVTIKVRVL